MNNTDLMHTVLELKRLAADLSGKAGSLVHAKKQMRKYPTSQAATDYHKRRLDEFFEAHNAYVEYANNELVNKNHEEFKFDGYGLEFDEWADA